MSTAEVIYTREKFNSSDEQVSALLLAIPGAAVLTSLASIDPFRLSAPARIDYLAAIERQAAWLLALQQRAIIAVAGNQPSKSDGEGAFFGVDESEREDISTAMRVAPTSAQSKIDVARTLINYLPNTCSALATGEISASHATVIAKETSSAIRDGLPDSAIFEIEQKALAFAEFHTPGQVARQVRATIAKLAPEIFEDLADHASQLRCVTSHDEPNGMCTVVAILPAPDAQIVLKAIDAFILTAEKIEKKVGSEVKLTMDMKRADALSAIASQYLSSVAGALTPHRKPVTINVTIDLPTLLGLAQNPGELAGYGPIPASVARELASDAKWRRFICDPVTGNLLDYGRESYIPPQNMVDFLLARDRICRFPGCRRSAHYSDLDHAQSWESGGQTSVANLGALCRRHHRLKTHDGWSVTSNSDGSCLWTSPHGKEYFTPARPVNEPI